jgi:triosephosphate isomerase
MNMNAERRPIIAANWKLHKTIAEATQFINDLQRQYSPSDALDVVLAAPFTMLAAMREHVEGESFHLAAQDVFWEAQGAYTGEVSAAMLCEVGCTYVIIGHSGLLTCPSWCWLTSRSGPLAPA